MIFKLRTDFQKHNFVPTDSYYNGLILLGAYPISVFKRSKAFFSVEMGFDSSFQEGAEKKTKWSIARCE